MPMSFSLDKIMKRKITKDKSLELRKYAAALDTLHHELRLEVDLLEFHRYRWYRHHDCDDRFKEFDCRITLLRLLDQDILALWFHFITVDGLSFPHEPARLTGRFLLLLDELNLFRAKILDLYAEHGRIMKCREPLSNQAWHDLHVTLLSIPGKFKQTLSC
jgi:hypothetical protein